MGDFPKADLHDYLQKFEKLFERIQKIAPDELGADDLQVIEVAKKHGFIQWLEKQDGFKLAQAKIRGTVYYKKAVNNRAWADHWWIQFKTVVAKGFYIYLSVQQNLSEYLILDSDKKDRIVELAAKLSKEIKYVHILEHVKGVRLTQLLDELQKRLISGDISSLSLSRNGIDAPRAMLIRYFLVASDYLIEPEFKETGARNYKNIICLLVSIIAPTEGKDIEKAFQRVMSKLGLEFKANRLEMQAEAAMLVARQLSTDNDPCPFCGQSKQASSA
ncbi:hypothetical protein SAMN02949497_4405 [Methylomagnum ishizawai]|uniref:Uncharacterized protein n=1 Tax=Methylomagnum ishizawai TaxID=1760988 RepID=A0A1Y6D3J3_9GAMM|nr:hypothetical protein [Methylomagnum ishizawai]SMF96990.1 hypothetical protein SAMN02949497_4405 [Methylomagnum ishizawai]